MKSFTGFKTVALVMALAIAGMLIVGPQDAAARWHDNSDDLPSDDSKTTTILIGAAAAALIVAAVVALSGGSDDEAQRPEKGETSEEDPADEESPWDSWDDEARLPQPRTGAQLAAILQVPVRDSAAGQVDSGVAVQPLCGLGCDRVVVGVGVSL